MGLKRTLNIFLVTKTITHLRCGTGKKSKIHWNGSGQPGLPEKTGVLENKVVPVMNGTTLRHRIQAVLGPCDTFPCLACGCQTGNWGLSGSQRVPHLGAVFHLFNWASSWYKTQSMTQSWSNQKFSLVSLWDFPQGFQEAFSWDCFNQRVFLKNIIYLFICAGS